MGPTRVLIQDPCEVGLPKILPIARISPCEQVCLPFPDVGVRRRRGATGLRAFDSGSEISKAKSRPA